MAHRVKSYRQGSRKEESGFSHREHRSNKTRNKNHKLKRLERATYEERTLRKKRRHEKDTLRHVIYTSGTFRLDN